MKHNEALNKLLSHSCSNPAYYPDDEKTREYTIDLCCQQMFVIAEPIVEEDQRHGYNIVAVLTASEHAARKFQEKQTVT